MLSPVSKPKKQQAKPKEIETLPDAWERFERAVDVVVKAKPNHRVAKPPKRSVRASS
jgi:hypothetical protein